MGLNLGYPNRPQCSMISNSILEFLGHFRNISHVWTNPYRQPLRGVGPSGCLHLSQAPAERRLRASICQAGLYHPGGTVHAASGTGVETTNSGSWTRWGFKRSTYYHGNPSHTHIYIYTYIFCCSFIRIEYRS